MKKPSPFVSTALLLIVANLGAQELDPITAKVFADDIVAPDQQELGQQPTLDQVVPVAEEKSDESNESDDSVEQLPAEPPQDFATPERVTVPLPADATIEEELIWNYERYKKLMVDGVFDEADSAAKRVVELAMQVRGARSTDFAKALTNLAIVQHRTQQYDAAQQNFQSAIEIIEDNEDRLNEQLVNPLKGLGASQLEGGRPDLANDSFRRAVHVTHVNEGPHNLEQIDILESIAEANLRLGATEDARNVQDTIFWLNQRAYAADTVALVESLMRRAGWQHRAGFINDERTTLRQAIRIIEVSAGKNDPRLVGTLMQLGRSYFYVDTSGKAAFQGNTMTTGEIYFKRALRISRESSETDWQLLANASLALGDYYMFDGSEQRARKIYKEAWDMLSADDERLAFRQTHLEQLVVLRERPIRQFAGKSIAGPDTELLQGNITITYVISTQGRATDLKIVEADPADFTDMQRSVQHEMRSRIYRPLFVDAVPTVTDQQLLIHKFFYQQADLDALRGVTEQTEPDQT